MRHGRVFLAMFLVRAALAWPVEAATTPVQNEQTKLLPTDGSAEDYFGSAVSCSGDSVVIGAAGAAGFQGAAYVFVRSGAVWRQQAKLLASDGAEDDYFGLSVAVSGDVAVIGAYRDDDNGPGSGSAYVFVRNGDAWAEQSKLSPADGADEDGFGFSVAVSGNVAVIGAQSDDDNGFRSGSAYVFVRNGDLWTEQAKLLPGDGAEWASFGWSVAVSGDVAIIGAIGGGDSSSLSGSAYVFVRDGDVWTEQAKLLPSDGAHQDIFGGSVAVSGDVAVIGAEFDDDSGTESGSAYVFVRNGDAWAEQTKLLPSDGAAEDYFGRRVSVSGDTAVVGAWGDDDMGDYSGAAYVFVRDGDFWTEQAKLLAADGAAEDYFGIHLSVAGDIAIISATRDDDSGSQSGSAYVFQVPALFVNGFETGDCTAWSSQVPPP